MIVICNIRDEFKDLIPHFYDHYHKLGITRFAFGVRGGKKNPAWNELSKYNVYNHKFFLIESYDAPLDEKEEGLFLNGVVRQIDEWYVPADLDEFHVISGHQSFSVLESMCVSAGRSHVKSKLIDRVASDGTIPPSIKPDIPIFDQFPKDHDITENIMGGCRDKVCLASPKTFLVDGHHNPMDGSLIPLSEEATYHFKWFGNIVAKESEKIEARIKNGYFFFTEGQKLLKHIEKHGGRLF